MHSKLMLLSHPTHLRIVVPSANLVPYDWGETGIMENVRKPLSAHLSVLNTGCGIRRYFLSTYQDLIRMNGRKKI